MCQFEFPSCQRHPVLSAKGGIPIAITYTFLHDIKERERKKIIYDTLGWNSSLDQKEFSAPCETQALLKSYIQAAVTNIILLQENVWWH